MQKEVKRQLKIALINRWRVVNAKGGTERVFCNMANEMARRGHKVIAICCDENTGMPGYPLDSRVTFINAYQKPKNRFLAWVKWKAGTISLSSKRRKEKRRAYRLCVLGKKLASAIKGQNFLPDVVVSYQAETTAALLKCFGDSVRIITMFHGKPSAPFFRLELFCDALDKSVFIQCLRPEFVKELGTYTVNKNIVVIPNAVPQHDMLADRSSKKIISVGRVSSEKRHILLLQAFELIRDEFKDWIIEIWGETGAPYWKNSMKVSKFILDNNLSNQVFLCGTTDSPNEKLKTASIFAFPSEMEGFGLALVEAMAMGLPAIGCLDCSAVNTIIRHEENGLLAEPIPESYAAALQCLMRSQSIREKLGNRAKKDAKEFSPEYVWDKWESLIQHVAGK